ncbi:MAG: serine/threonine-protein phosphatase [Candidatus Riflebacteria bacterium]|nr:serine/threonine-protein phosphatase [Candidatus Riflebacteria bacterium]
MIANFPNELLKKAMDFFCLLVLFLVPMVVSYSRLENWRFVEEELFIKKIENTFEKTLSRIEANSDPMRFAERVFQQMEKRCFAGDDALSNFQKLSKILKKHFPGLLEFTFTDHQGNVIESVCDTKPPRFLLKKFFFDYQEFLSGKTNSLSKSRQFIRVFFGKLMPNFQEIHGRLFLASQNIRRRYVYFSRPCKRGMFICHVTHPDNWELLPLFKMIKWENQRFRKNLRVGFYDMGEEKIFPELNFFMSRENILPFLECSISKMRFSFSDEKVALYSKPINSRVCLFAELDISQAQKKKNELCMIVYRTYYFLAGLLIVSAYFFRNLFFLFFSLRIKLLFIFSFAVGVPLLMISLSMFTFISDRKEILEKQVYSEVIEELSTFDKGFKVFLNGSDKVLNTELGKIERIIDPALQLEELSKMVRKYKINQVRVFDRSGKQVMHCRGSQRLSSQDSNLENFGSVAVEIIKKYESGNTSFESKSSAEITRTALTNLEGFNWYSTMISQNIGKISILDFSNIKMVFFSTFFRDGFGTPTHFLLMVWEKEFLEEIYIKRHLLNLWRKIPNTKVWVLSGIDQERSLPYKKKWPLGVSDFLGMLRTSGKSKVGSGRDGAKSILLSGFRCGELENRFLLALTSDDWIKRQLQVMKKNVFAVSIVTVLLSLLCAVFLSREFLLPVSNLRKGVEALRIRNFQCRLPVSGSSDWRNLFSAFNKVMDGMTELEIAKILQDGFFPSSELNFCGIQIFGTCSSAMQVGGDFFDYRIVDSDKCLIIVGDVSGHGVSAALVVGMVKALITHPDTGANPAEIIQLINNVFLQTLRRKKMMTLVVALLDSAKQTILFSNAGQSYPLIVRGGNPIEVSLPSYPLGARVLKKTTLLELPIRPGDLIVFYTDGLIEYPDVNGEVVGYSNFYAFLSRISKNLISAVQVVSDIQHWLISVVKDSPQPDDITILACKINGANSDNKSEIEK